MNCRNLVFIGIILAFLFCSCRREIACKEVNYVLPAELLMQPHKRVFYVGDTFVITLKIPLKAVDLRWREEIDISNIKQILVEFAITTRFPLIVNDTITINRLFKINLIEGFYDVFITPSSSQRYIRMQKKNDYFVASVQIITLQKGIFATGFVDGGFDRECGGAFLSRAVSGSTNLDLLAEVNSSHIRFNWEMYVFKVD